MSNDTKKSAPEPVITVVENEKEKDKLQREVTFTFDLDVPGVKHFVGTFKARRLTIGMHGQVGVHHARLNGGMAIATDLDYIHFQMAYCRIALLEFPEWWTPETFYEEEYPVLSKVFEYVRHWETSFRK